MQTSTLKTADGLALHVVHYPPVTAPKAVIFLIHGVNEHSGRYAHVAQFFNQRGCAVIAYDHRGHGRSEGEKTYFASFEQAVDDMKQVFDSVVKAQYPNLPIFVYGHSMGSLISTLFVLKYQALLRGYVTSGTPLDTETTLPVPVVRALSALSRVLPKTRLISLDVRGISRDEAVIAANLADELNDHKPLRLIMARHIVDHARLAKSQLRAITLPILIIHGDADPICPHTGSEYFYAHAGSSDKKLELYPGLYHELHNEPEQNTVLADVALWMEQRL